MTSKLLLALLLLSCCCSLQAQKLYKIVDEQGNVSFSQFPPVTKKENEVVEDVNVDSGPQSIVTEELHGSYCGKIKLPGPASSASSAESYVKNLDKMQASWEQQLAQLSKKVDISNQNAIKSNQHKSAAYYRYNQQYQSAQSKQYQQTVALHGEQLRDLRCAIGWAEKQTSDKHELILKNQDERARLEKIKNDLELQLDANCGELPAYDPTREGNSAMRKSWYNCSDDLRGEIDRVKREISKS